MRPVYGNLYAPARMRDRLRGWLAEATSVGRNISSENQGFMLTNKIAWEGNWFRGANFQSGASAARQIF
jgi:hypothetical protein